MTPPAALREVGFDQRLGETLPLDVTLRDDAGREVRLRDYFGRKPVALSLVYFDCPMLCTVSLNGLLSALEVVSFLPGREFELLTISFDPKEGPELAAHKKKAYLGRLKRPGAEARLALPDRRRRRPRPDHARRSASAMPGTTRRASSRIPRGSSS